MNKVFNSKCTGLLSSIFKRASILPQVPVDHNRLYINNSSMSFIFPCGLTPLN